MTRIFVFVVLSVFCLNWSAHSQDGPLPVEFFADRPAAELVSLSPDGSMIAFVRNQGLEQFIVIQDLKSGEIVRATELKDVKPRRVSFATNGHVLITMSVFKGRDGLLGKGELSRLASYSVKTGKSVQLLEKVREIGFQDKLFNLTNIVGIDQNEQEVYMGAYGFGSSGTYDIFKIDLDTGNGDPVFTGVRNVRDYYVNSDGQPILRWSYSNVQDSYELEVWNGKGWQTRLRESDRGLPNGILGVSPDGLKAYTRFSNDPWSEVFEIDLLAELNEPVRPVLSAPEAETGSVLRDTAGVAIGVRHSGFLPSYTFFDDNLTIDVTKFQQQFGGAPVWLSDWSADFDQLLYRVEIALGPAVYIVQTRSTGSAVRVADANPRISTDQLGKPAPFYYTARDGAKVPSVLTLPAGGMGIDPRPLILMPHGGPESYDSVSYDWMAQVFANRGYVVLQPNFRGSTGFGRAWRNQGRGDWRGIMQTDVIDGLNALVEMGMVDKNRVCIVGASYGGYSALALAAFYPSKVGCAVAIAPVSDLPRMLAREQAVNGRASWVMEYWSEVIGDWRSEEERLAAASPARFANQVDAPVLLIHGDEDIVVPYEQSKIMYDALKKAGKAVQIKKIRKADHWLSNTIDRRIALSEAVEFVKKHAPANKP